MSDALKFVDNILTWSIINYCFDSHLCGVLGQTYGLVNDGVGTNTNLLKYFVWIRVGWVFFFVVREDEFWLKTKEVVYVGFLGLKFLWSWVLYLVLQVYENSEFYGIFFWGFIKESQLLRVYKEFSFLYIRAAKRFWKYGTSRRCESRTRVWVLVVRQLIFGLGGYS